MPVVFEPLWVQQLVERYEKSLSYQRPALFRVATHPWGQADRDRVEKWVSLLPPEAQPGVIRRIRDPRGFEHAYNELLVGELLRQYGHIPQYEVRFADLAPDWFVPAARDHAPFIVEVLTIEPDAKSQRERLAWRELKAKLEALQFNGRLFAEGMPGTELSGKWVDSAVRFAKNWLASSAPMRGETVQTDYGQAPSLIHFEASTGSETEPSQPLVFVSSPFRFHSETRIAEIIRAKVRKYRSLCKEETGLVIAVVATFDSFVDKKSLENALFGALQFQITRRDNKIIESQYVRDRKGLVTPRYDKDKDRVVLHSPALSAALLVEEVAGATPRAAHNPFASVPLPASVFPGIPNLVVTSKEAGSVQMDWE